MEQTSVQDYFQRLSELMLGMEATGGSGARLPLEEASQQAIGMILEVRSSGRKVMLVGNGGSSAIVSHVQNDLCKAVGVRALVFTEQPLLTALANDDGYVSVYQRPVQLWSEPGDLMLAVSSSGRSENILRAAQSSIDQDCRLITLSGFRPDNPLRRMGHLNFYVPSEVYGYVETAHAALAHFITDRAKSVPRSWPTGVPT